MSNDQGTRHKKEESPSPRQIRGSHSDEAACKGVKKGRPLVVRSTEHVEGALESLIDGRCVDGSVEAAGAVQEALVTVQRRC